ncbi:hypothetical protein H2198_000727 [Neophaeococcomyces mojaviensis]|uniref:Uncharacterized protein n=1 Tax=Neophaeococcomyces mojaviensis TaxID=3383035 RepID=A0ACC3AJ50_9EURO|nr:hypothetical protein H2198_000727 [Knufia sp. JES_112]
MAFTDSDRQRIAHFRRRWAEENFEKGYSAPEQAQNSDTVDHDVELSEVKAQRPAQAESSLRKAQKRSWRDNLKRASPARLADVSAPSPTTVSSNVVSSRTPHGTYSDEESAMADQSPDPSKPESEQSATAKKPPAWLTELYTLAWLTFFALLGTLARLGVEAITQYPDAPVTSRVLWANLGGSLIMGFLVEDRNLFGLPTQPSSSSNQPPVNSKVPDEEPEDESKLSATHLKHKKTIPLYIGLTTGFCGSFTSFSSFLRDVFLALTNGLPRASSTSPYHAPATAPQPRNGGFSFLAACAILILHPAVSLAALHTGAHLALLLRHLLPSTSPQRPKSFTFIPPKLLSTILNPLIVLLGFGSWLLGALFLTIFPPTTTSPSPTNWRARATIPLLFAPLGCILRYYLAKYLNRPSTPHFPWGTFVANIFGTLILGMAWDLQHATGIGAGAGVGSGSACAVLLGVQEGFCGCLTTVSTWVVELSGLGRRHAWMYGGTSVVVGVAGLVVVMGSMGWTVGFAAPVCG